MASENGQEKRETLADIVAEMRKVKGFPVPYAPSGYDGVWATDLIDFADRIEAAWKRERAEIEAQALSIGGIVESSRHKQKPQGNAAAMRDALVCLKNTELAFCENNVRLGVGLTALGMELHCRIMRELIEPALAAPPRNCDLKELSTDEGIVSAHERFCESWHDGGKTCAECPNNPKSPLIKCREKWLLAPSAEKGATE